MSESILQEAQRLIHGERNKNYGHPRDNFGIIARLFSGYLDRPISDIDVANLMILVKVARVEGTGYHRDSFTDIAGYAGCVERIYEEDEEIPQRIFADIEDIPEGVIAVEEDKTFNMYAKRKNGLLYVSIHHSDAWVEWHRSMRDFKNLKEVV